jgi:FixJ family two-component response regulator
MAHILSAMKIEARLQVIAIADDDPRVLESLGELLESAGYSVRLFNSADAFLRADAVNEIDALISDIRMPGVDGIELQRRLV